jgi:catechol 2,3-dioxygenase-like lactoylglutathione lyase family enzyme
MIRYNGVNHLALVTGDMDMTIRYYRDLLGMRLVAGLGKSGYRHYFFSISETDLIAFFEWPDVSKPAVKDHGVPVKGPATFDHVSIGVQDREELIELKNRLSAADFWVSEIIDHGFIHSIYSFDPNNIPIEFSWNVPGMDIRRSPRMMDVSPSAVTLEGPEPQPGKWPAPGLSPPDDMDTTVYPGEGQIFLKEK